MGAKPNAELLESAATLILTIGYHSHDQKRVYDASFQFCELEKRLKVKPSAVQTVSSQRAAAMLMGIEPGKPFQLGEAVSAARKHFPVLAESIRWEETSKNYLKNIFVGFIPNKESWMK
jgi:hypothetical protein